MDLVRMCVLSTFLCVGAYIVGLVALRHGSDAARKVIDSVVTTPESKQLAPPPPPSAKTTSDTVDDIKRPAILAGVMAVVGLAISFLAKFKEVFGNPFSIDLVKLARSPKYEDQVSFVEQFHDDFAKVVHSYVQSGEKVFVFIDDLDRCEVPKAADLVQGLNLLVSDIPNFVFVIGMDREKVAAALAIKFEKALPYFAPRLGAKEAIGNAVSVAKGGLVFGYSFIEKFVQVPFRLPRPTNEIDRFLFSLANDVNGDSQAPSLLDVEEQDRFALTIKNDSPRVREIGKAMAESFDYNPRRLKQFLNVFRLKAWIASNTGLFRGENALTLEQLGKFVTIGLKWPLLMADLVEQPQLLAELERKALAITPNYGSDPEADEPFNQWTDSKNLQRFFRVGAQDSQNLGAEWSLEKVDIVKVLRVSPPVKAAPTDVSQSDSKRASDPLPKQETQILSTPEPLPGREVRTTETSTPRQETSPSKVEAQPPNKLVPPPGQVTNLPGSKKKTISTKKKRK